jgi:hypothetical protein
MSPQGSIIDIQQDIYVINDDERSFIEVQIPNNRSGSLGVSHECIIGDDVAVVGRVVFEAKPLCPEGNQDSSSTGLAVRIRASKFIRLPFEPNRKEQWMLALAELKRAVYPLIAKEQGSAIENYVMQSHHSL